MLNDNLVKQELQKLIDEDNLNKKVTGIRLEPNTGKYFVALDNNAKAVIIEEWIEDYIDGRDINRRAQIIQSIKTAAEWK